MRLKTEKYASTLPLKYSPINEKENAQSMVTATKYNTAGKVSVAQTSV
jgi:hypothetical protein